MKISLVIPVKNEEESIPALAAEVSEVFGATAWQWECIWVDDASTDRTPAVLRDLAARAPNHRWVRMTRSFGQSGALAAGFRLSRGELLAMMDGDGQNDPHDFPALVQLLESSGVDMVNGVRRKRQDNLIRKFSSKLANGFRNWLTRESVSDVGCAIRVFRRECFGHIPVFKGMHRFFPTLARMKGYRITEQTVNHRPRTQGRTKYGIHNRLWVGIADVFAVRWMQWRFVFPEVADASPLPSQNDAKPEAKP